MSKLHGFLLKLSVITLCLKAESKTDFKRLLLDNPDEAAARLLHLEANQQMLIQQLGYLNETLKNTVTELLQVHNGQSATTMNRMGDYGSTYIRWGRTSCPDSDTELVYSGYAAGQHFAHKYANHFGGPSNALCLPSDPNVSKRRINDWAAIYGMEYQDNFVNRNDHGHDVPCVLCRRLKSTTSVMIPGRNSCYPGWRREYIGYIAADSHDHTASSYICVDMNPEHVNGGLKIEGGRYLHIAGTKCGPLQCPPYTELSALYCVVCSR